MSVRYRDRNYIVYKGGVGLTLTNKIEEVLSKPKYCQEDEKTRMYKNLGFRMARNVSYDENGKLFDFIDYYIHHYKNYDYLFDFDIDSLMMQYEGVGLDADSLGLCGGYDCVRSIYDFAGLNGNNYYELLPKLLYNSNNSDLAYLMMNYYAPDNLSYVIYDKEADKLRAISVKKHDLDLNNYDGIYYSIINDNEQILSNNPDLILEFSNNAIQLPDNCLYEDGMVRELKWK